MAKPLDQRIDQLKQKQMRDAARLAALEAKAKQANRKLDTRRKIIIGAAVLSEMERVPRFADYVRTMLQKAVTRPQDREAIALLLPPVAVSTPPAPAVEAQPAPAEAPPPEAIRPPAPPVQPAASRPPVSASVSFNPQASNDLRSRFASLRAQLPDKPRRIEP